MKETETARHAKQERELVGRNVKTLREGQRLTKVRLSMMAGMSRQELTKIEAGEANATLNTLVRLADALDVAPADLFAEQPNE